MAMLNGASLVIELPVVYSTASAELFATASIALLDSLNCIDYLCFGCETDSVDLLNTVCRKVTNTIRQRYKIYLHIELKTRHFIFQEILKLDECLKYSLDYSLNVLILITMQNAAQYCLVT